MNQLASPFGPQLRLSFIQSIIAAASPNLFQHSTQNGSITHWLASVFRLTVSIPLTTQRASVAKTRRFICAQLSLCYESVDDKIFKKHVFLPDSVSSKNQEEDLNKSKDITSKDSWSNEAEIT